MNSNLVTIFILELILLYLIALVFYYLFLLIRKIKIEDRFLRYTIYKKEENSKIFDLLFELGNNFIKSFSKFLYKFSFLDKYSLKYQKYIKKEDREKINRMDYVSKKIIISFIFLIIVLLYDLFKYQKISIFQILISMLFGFYVLDLFLLSTSKVIERKKKNDILRAITIMNNSFKSGHSIMQSMKLVSDELDSEIGLEFKKMYVDLTYGLSLDVVFKRFESRVNMDEVKYITTSLQILNDTGGDIVKVFESVEKTFFNNKKLEDELKNLTAASKMLYRILLFIPIFFVLVIYLLDNTYFSSLFTNPIGYMIIFISLLLYITYIFAIKKVMEVGNRV